MKGRLAFSVLRHLEADVFLLDEALSAGDRAFYEKCRQHFLTAREGHSTYVIASHDLEFVREHCDRAVWLDAGQVRQEGPAGEVLDGYISVRPTRSGSGQAAATAKP
jgi:ABC-type polysaccharide/polyol phosphate transport system ATPase subunit